MRMLLGEFGMTPSSRSRIGVNKSDKPKDDIEDLIK
jgi:hypothetical protein